MKHKRMFALATLTCLAWQLAYAHPAAGSAVTIENGEGPCHVVGDISFDMGTVPLSGLRPDRGALQPVRTIPFAVKCSGPQRFGLRLTDNAPGKAYTGPWLDLNGIDRVMPAERSFSLGTASNGAPNGLMAVSITGKHGGKGTHVGIYSMDGGQTWTADRSVGHWLPSSASGYRTGFVFYTAPKDMPEAFESLDLEMQIHPVAAPPQSLGGIDSVNLKGSATLELFYF